MKSKMSSFERIARRVIAALSLLAGAPLIYFGLIERPALVNDVVRLQTRALDGQFFPALTVMIVWGVLIAPLLALVLVLNLKYGRPEGRR